MGCCCGASCRRPGCLITPANGTMAVIFGWRLFCEDFSMADFYGTVDGYKEYHNARGRGTIIADQDDDEIAAGLLIGSEYIDGRYGPIWLNSHFRTGGRNQERVWPLLAFVDASGYALPSDIVPVEVEKATYEAAFRQVENPGSLMVDYTPNKYKSASVDGAVSVTFAEFYSSADVQLTIPDIDRILQQLISGNNGFSSSLSGDVNRV